MKEELLVIDADYIMQGSKPMVRLFCKNIKGETVLVQDSTFLPYFYVLPKKGKADELKKKIEKLDTKKIETKILKVEVVEKNWMNETQKFLKVFIDNPRRIQDARHVVKHLKEFEDAFEYDITFYKRYIIDKQIEPLNWIEVSGSEVEERYGLQVDRTIEASSVKAVDVKKEIKMNVLSFDTEWIDDKEKNKLIMISLADNGGYKKVLTLHEWKNKPNYVEVLKDEKSMIERFVEIVKEKDSDFLVGYNSDGFDIPMLKDCANELKVSLKLGRDDSSVYVVRRGRISSAKTKGRVHIDIFNFISHVLAPSLKSEVLTLDEVAQELLGVGKKKMDYKDMANIWSTKEDMERLAEYSMWDAELTIKLANLILPQIFALSRFTGQLPFDVCRYTYSQLVEGFFIRKASADDVIIPNRPKAEEIEERRMEPAYKGAIVIEPKKGIHSDVLVFDFRSLYPTIIVTHNIDPWTFNFKGCKKKYVVPEHKNWYFCADKKGFIPQHLAELIKLRQQVKQDMRNEKNPAEHMKLNNEQFALKTVANATYGYLAYFGAKWYRRECGAAAASWGRHYIGKVIDEAKQQGFEIIYGDTDSLMAKHPKIKTQQKLRETGEKIAKIINDKLPGIIELEFRGLYKGGIFVAREKDKEGAGAKKRYALVDYKGNLEIRGFEAVRRDWCELSKRIQREVLVTILRDKNPAKAVKLVRDTIEKIKTGKVELDDLAIFEQITRPLSAYQAIGPHVKAAMKARDRGRPVGEGTVVAFVITKGRGSISDRAEPLEDVKPGQYDPEYYINNQVLPAAMRVLKALGYEEKEILSGKIQKKLEAWIKK